MAALILPSRRVVQPQGPVEVDWGNPLARGLMSAWSGGIVSTRATPLKAAPYGVNAASKYGVGGKGNGASTSVLLPSDAISPSTSGVAFGTRFALVRAGAANASRVILGGGSGKNAWRLGSGGSVEILSVDTNLIFSAPSVVSAWELCALGVTLVGQNGGEPVRVWKNGALVASGLSTNNAGATSSTPYLGQNGNNSQYFDGEIYHHLAFDRVLSDGEMIGLFANPWQLFKPASRRIIIDLGAGGGTSATASATPANVTTTAQTATATGAASAQATPAQVTSAPSTALAIGSASAQATPADASAIPATGTATGAALALSAPASVQLTPATATASGEAGASVEATATPAPITIAESTATATGSASAQATTAQVTTTAPTATAASGISASATLAAIGLMPATGVATGAAIASAIPAQIIITPAQATAAGSAWAYSAPAQISVTPATGSASEYIKPLYSEDPSAQFVAYPVEDHSVDYPLRLMAVNYPFDSNKVDFPLRALRVNYPKQ